MNEQEIYILGLWEYFGEQSICGVYTNKQKLLEDYRKLMEGSVSSFPYANDRRKAVIYGFRANEFIGETPEWNDGKLYIPDYEHEISIQELEENGEQHGENKQ